MNLVVSVCPLSLTLYDLNNFDLCTHCSRDIEKSSVHDLLCIVTLPQEGVPLIRIPEIDETNTFK